jgi:hypothetical protein
MVANTAILISAKETPMTKNRILKYQNPFVKGVIKQKIETKAKPNNIDFFNPILGKKEAKIKEAMAIGISLNPSKTLALPLETSMLRCTCNMTVPTLFNRNAKTK